MATSLILCRPNFLVSKLKILINPTNAKLIKHNFGQESVTYDSLLLSSSKRYSTTMRVVSGNKFFLEKSSSLDIDGELFTWNGLERDLMPKHIGIALDGNRRWLKSRGLDLDYTPYFDKNFLFVQLCLKWGIPKITGYILGLGNFTKRGKDFNDLFLGQFQKFLEVNFEYFKRNGVKIMVIGETHMVSESIQPTINKVVEGTKHNSKLEFTLAVCYSGQRDITNATRKICEKVKQGLIEATDINEGMIEKELSFPCSPPLDLYIRTGDELRVGGLLAWQVAHVELYVTEIMAPDFGEDVFLDALRSFQKRNRKFGK